MSADIRFRLVRVEVDTGVLDQGWVSPELDATFEAIARSISPLLVGWERTHYGVTAEKVGAITMDGKPWLENHHSLIVQYVERVESDG